MKKRNDKQIGEIKFKKNAQKTKKKESSYVIDEQSTGLTAISTYTDLLTGWGFQTVLSGGVDFSTRVACHAVKGMIKVPFILTDIGINKDKEDWRQAAITAFASDGVGTLASAGAMTILISFNAPLVSAFVAATIIGAIASLLSDPVLDILYDKAEETIAKIMQNEETGEIYLEAAIINKDVKKMVKDINKDLKKAQQEKRTVYEINARIIEENEEEIEPLTELNVRASIVETQEEPVVDLDVHGTILKINDENNEETPTGFAAPIAPINNETPIETSSSINVQSKNISSSPNTASNRYKPISLNKCFKDIFKLLEDIEEFNTVYKILNGEEVKQERVKTNRFTEEEIIICERLREAYRQKEKRRIEFLKRQIEYNLRTAKEDMLEESKVILKPTKDQIINVKKIGIDFNGKFGQYMHIYKVLEKARLNRTEYGYGYNHKGNTRICVCHMYDDGYITALTIDFGKIYIEYETEKELDERVNKFGEYLAKLMKRESKNRSIAKGYFPNNKLPKKEELG